MPAPNPSLITWLVLVPLIAWRMVSRFKRLTQRQRLSRIRPWITLTIFPLIVSMLAMTAFLPQHEPQPMKLIWLAAGLTAGALLSIYGLKMTQFEAIKGEGLFYTPHAPLGIVLFALFAVRVLWRLGDLALRGSNASQGPEFVLSPYTLAPVGLFAGYYIAYAIGLLMWRWKVLKRRKENG
jgi:hypothetical protein